MGLADIAAGLETTATQEARGVATVDDTDRSLAERLGDHAADLPCTASAAASLAEAYVGGADVGEAGRAAGVAPVTAAKTLHRLGFEGLCPLGPTGRRVVRDWVAGDLSRTEARRLTGASDREFALAAYVCTHEPLDGARAAVDGALSPVGESTPGGDALADAMPEGADR